MSKQKGKKTRRYQWKAIRIFIMALLLIACSFLVLYIRCYHDNNTPFSIDIDSRNVGLQKEVEVSIRPIQSWVSLEREDGYVSGAQYDGVIINNLDKNVRDWELTIYLPQEGVIDSSWNGIYEEVNDTIVIKPMDYNNLVVQGDEQTFGFVLYSKMKLEFVHFSMTGYYQVAIQEYPMFWILIVLSICWIAAAVIYIGVFFKMYKLEMQREKDQKIISQAMMTFAHLVDAKDEYTKEHSLRVALYAAEIARRSGMSEEEVKILKYIALVHDCGKVGVPDSILKKTGALTPEEKEIINSHTILGGHILEYFTSIEGIREGALCHHERYDGYGYPNKIKGQDIPVCARIIGVADAYDAMSSDRCYRAKLPKDVILQELKGNSGSQFDPVYVKHMINMMEDGTAERIQLEKVQGVDITIL